MNVGCCCSSLLPPHVILCIEELDAIVIEMNNRPLLIYFLRLTVLWSPDPKKIMKKFVQFCTLLSKSKANSKPDAL